MKKWIIVLGLGSFFGLCFLAVTGDIGVSSSASAMVDTREIRQGDIIEVQRENGPRVFVVRKIVNNYAIEVSDGAGIGHGFTVSSLAKMPWKAYRVGETNGANFDRVASRFLRQAANLEQ